MTHKDHTVSRAGGEAGRTVLAGTGPRWAVIGIFFILAFTSITLARDFLMPLTMSVLLFFVFVPLRRKASRLGIPASLVAAAVVSGLVALVLVIGFTLSGPASNMIAGAPQIAEKVETKFDGLRDRISDLRNFAQQIEHATDGKKEDEPASVASSLPAQDKAAAGINPQQSRTPDNPRDDRQPENPDSRSAKAQQTLNEVVPMDSTNAAIGVLQQTPALAGQMMFVLILLFFMLSSGDLLYLKIVQSFTTLGEKRRAYAALREIEDLLGSYLGTITVINAGLGTAIGIAMWLWGMPAPAIFGVMAFLLNYIPYIGLLCGAVVATIIALVSMPGFVTPLLVGGTYVLLSSIEGQLITPYSVSRRLSLNTVVVFITIALWAWLWSVVGMIVAVPLLVVARVLCDYIPGLERIGNFLGGDMPVPLGPEGEEFQHEEEGTGSAPSPAE